MRLTQISVKRPVLVTMLMIGLAGIGVFCYVQLPRQMFPDVEFPMVTVVTTYEGAGPEEIEQLIVKELEDEISTIEGIKHLHGTSQQGLGLVIAEFYLDIDVDTAAADVRAKVNIARNRLPEEADDPIVEKFDFNAQPIMQVSIAANRPLREVFHIADERIKDRLATVPGVASVTVMGGEEREIHILTDQQRLRSHALSITDVIAAVAAANLESPGGYIRQNSREYNIRLRGKFTDLDQLRNMPIMLPSGSSVYLRDIADVRDSFKEIRDKIRADGKTCVGISIQKRADGNTVAADATLRKQLEKLRGELPSDYEIIVQDEKASWITSSIDNVFSNMKIGIVLTAVALFLFLHSFRSVVIISMTMPLSVLATFIIMYLMGFTLNLMSLMGLAMTIGVLVNNAILVLENIYRHLHLGHDPNTAAIDGTAEIAVAVASTTLTNVVVFVPIAFMGGIVGQFFKDFGLTATFATIVSLFISFTLAPMLAARLLTKANTTPVDKGIIGHIGHVFDAKIEKLTSGYARALRACLRHRVITVTVVFAMLIGAFVLSGQIGSEFITSMDQGKFIITVEMPTGTRLEETDAAIKKLEQKLTEPDVLPELMGTYCAIGQTFIGEMGGASRAVNIGQISVTILPKDERELSTQEIMDRLRPELADAGIVGARIKLLEGDAGGGTEAAIILDLTGDDIGQLRELAARTVDILTDPQLTPGAVDVDTNYRLGQPEIRIIPDREKCRDADVDSRFIAQVVAATFEGLQAGEYRDGAFDYDIRVRADERSRANIADIEKLTIMNRRGHLIPLPQLADIVRTSGPSQLSRKDRRSLVTITCDVTGRSPGDVVKDIEKHLPPVIKQYPGCNYAFAGEVEHMRESFGRMFVALIMAICLTYLLLASLLESFVQPLMILVSLPLSLIGVFAALFLMGGTFSIFSIMSIVMLVGLVINNSIIVIDYINLLRRKGMERTEAIVEAGTTRLRPILMANLTTVVALIPLAMGMGWGGEMRAPMAMVQIGGLIAGGWMGLIVIPVIYTLSDDLTHLFGWKKKAGAGE